MERGSEEVGMDSGIGSDIFVGYWGSREREREGRGMGERWGTWWVDDLESLRLGAFDVWRVDSVDFERVVMRLSG